MWPRSPCRGFQLLRRHALRRDNGRAALKAKDGATLRAGGLAQNCAICFNWGGADNISAQWDTATGQLTILGVQTLGHLFRIIVNKIYIQWDTKWHFRYYWVDWHWYRWHPNGAFSVPLVVSKWGTREMSFNSLLDFSSKGPKKGGGGTLKTCTPRMGLGVLCRTPDVGLGAAS